MNRMYIFVFLTMTMCACSDLNAEQAIVNTVGVLLPSDAAPLSAQTLRLMSGEPRTLDATLDNYGTGGSQYIFERLALLDEEDQLIPGAADSFSCTKLN